MLMNTAEYLSIIENIKEQKLLRHNTVQLFM